MLISMFVLVGCLFFVTAEYGAAQSQEQTDSDKGIAQNILWFPADSQLIQWFHPEHDSIFMYIKNSFGQTLPKCFHEIVAQNKSHYQVARFWGDESIHIHSGDFNRDKVEKCLPEIFKPLGLQITTKQDGPITEIVTQSGSKRHIGWSKNGFVVWHRERERVEDFLSNKTSLKANKGMVSMLGRIESSKKHSHVLWTVSTIDLSKFIFSKKSKGFTLVINKEKKRADATIVFGSKQQAQAAKIAMKAKAKNPELAEPLRNALSSMSPTVVGVGVVIDITPYFQDIEVMKALMATIQKGIKN